MAWTYMYASKEAMPYVTLWMLMVLALGLVWLTTDICFLLNGNLFSLGWASLEVSVWLDWVSVALACTVLLISLFVSLFSVSYMALDFRLIRFMLILMSFVSSMLLVSLSGSWALLFMGWEGLGFSSYFLVFYFESFTASAGAYMTAYMNRIGDYTLLSCLFLSCCVGMASMKAYEFNFSVLSKLMGTLLLVSVMCKSAQFPFSAWLPAAMAAPTPVSALVHSSTLVAAGVYVGIRSSCFMGLMALCFLGVVSSWSSLVSSLSALYCMDGKKVVALSTLSQISIVGITLSLGLPSLAFFHLLTHAFVKSYLFVSLGQILHSSSGAQDYRSISLPMSRPISSLHVSCSLAALMALPFLSIFFSKESLVLSSALSGSSAALALGLVIGSLGTALYCLRMSYWLFSCDSSSMGLNLKDVNVTIVLLMSFMGSSMLGYQLMNSSSWFSLEASTLGPLALGSLLIGLFMVWSMTPMGLGFKDSWGTLGSGLFVFTSSGSVFTWVGQSSFSLLKALDLGYLEKVAPTTSVNLVKASSNHLLASSTGFLAFFIGSFSLSLMVLVSF